MNDAGWISTTHNWAATVDHAHLAAIRSAADAVTPDGTTGTIVRFRPDVALAPVPADGLAELLAQAWPVLAVEVVDGRHVLP